MGEVERLEDTGDAMLKAKRAPFPDDNRFISQDRVANLFLTKSNMSFLHLCSCKLNFMTGYSGAKHGL